MSLTTYALLPSIRPLKQFLEIESATDDRAIERIVEAVGAMIQRATGRQFISRTYSGVIFSGDGTNRLALPQYPVKDVTAVYLYRTATADGTALSSTYYEWATEAPEEGILYLLEGYLFPTGHRNIKLDYEAGYKTVTTTGYHTLPYDLQELVFQYSAWLWRRRDTLGEEIESMSYEGATKRYATRFWTDDRKAILQKYKRRA